MWSQDPFITTWKTDNPGSSNITSITIPTDSNPIYSYNYDVDWNNDGTYDSLNVTGSITHDYGKPGTYTIRIRGDFPKIYFNNRGDRRKIIEINQWGDQQWENLNSAFEGCTDLFENAADAPNLSVVTSMSEMFRNATNFKGDLSNWEVSNVPWMVATFQNCISFNNDISGWEVDNCNSIRFMFSGARGFNQDISGWDIDGMTNIQNTFSGASSFDQDLSEWNISDVTNMTALFDNSGMSRINYDKTINGWAEQTVQQNVTLGAQGLEYCSAEFGKSILENATNSWTIIGDEQVCPRPFVSVWDTRNVIPNGVFSDTTDIRISGLNLSDFYYDVDWESDGIYDEFGRTISSFYHQYDSAGVYTVSIRGAFPSIHTAGDQYRNKWLDIIQWGDMEWETLFSAFRGCENIQITAVDTPNLSKVSSLTQMFSGAISFNSPINHWDISNVTRLMSVFDGAESFNQPLNNWDVSSVTEMSQLFYDASSFNQSLDQWLVDSVVSMSGMFEGASSFNQPLSDWNVSKVESMSRMFYQATSFNQPLDDWSTDSLMSLEDIFNEATAFNGAINSWDVSRVTDFNGVFSDAQSFNQPLDMWETDQGEYMGFMFQNANSFNQDVSGWNVENVRDMRFMFSNAESFNQPIGQWDIGKVRDVNSMFQNASSFNQSLEDWNITSISDMEDFLNNSDMSVDNYDATLTSWADIHVDSFANSIEEIGVEELFYCQANAARDTLRLRNGWRFDGDNAANTSCIPNCFNITNTFLSDGDDWTYFEAWDRMEVPNPCHNVIIPLDTGAVLYDEEIGSAHTLEVASGGEIEVRQGGTLEVNLPQKGGGGEGM